MAIFLGSCPLLHTLNLSCQCASPRKHQVCVVLSLWLPSPLHTFCLLIEWALPRKHWVWVVLLSSAPLSLAHVFISYAKCALPPKHWVCVELLYSVPFPFALVLFVMRVCFASQTSVLCSASLFSSLPLFAHVCLPVCFVSHEWKYCFRSASLSAFRVFLAFENTNIYEFQENINLCCLIWEKETIVPFLDATTIEDTPTSEYTSYLRLSRKL